MKKLITLLLALSIVLSMAACGTHNEEEGIQTVKVRISMWGLI